MTYAFVICLLGLEPYQAHQFGLSAVPVDTAIVSENNFVGELLVFMREAGGDVKKEAAFCSRDQTTTKQENTDTCMGNIDILL